MRRAVRVLAAVLLALAALVLPALARWWWPRATVEEVLVSGLAPWMRAVALLALLAVTGAAWRARRALSGNRDWIAAALLVALAGPLAAWYLAPRHAKVYFDEDIYTQVGVTMALEDRAGIVGLALPDPTRTSGWRALTWTLNKEPAGASFLFSLGVPFAGVDASLGRSVNLALFGLGILGLAFLVRQAPHLAGRPWAALVPAALQAAWPENLRWAVTAAAEPGAVALACWALALAARAGRTRHPLDRIAACAVAALAIPMRPEGLLLGLPFALLAAGPTLIAVPRSMPAVLPALGRSLAWAALLAVLLAPHLLQLAIVAGEDWGAAGPKFTLAALPSNLADNIGYWFLATPPGRNTPAAPSLVGALAAVGCVAYGVFAARAASRARRLTAPRALPWLAAMGAWGAVAFGIFLPFYAGSYHHGSDVRFSLLVVPVVCVLAAVGAETLARAVSGAAGVRRFLVGLLLVPPMATALTHVAAVTDESWQARADRAGVSVLAGRLEANAIVASHVPSAWLMERVAAVQAAQLASSPELREALAARYPLYLHVGYWDRVDTHPGRVADVLEAGRSLRRLDGWQEVAVLESRGGPATRLLRWSPPGGGGEPRPRYRQ